MTREAKSLSWDGRNSPALPANLELYSRNFRVFRKDDRIFVTGPDLHAVGRKLASLAQLKEVSVGWKRQQAESLFATEAETTRELVLLSGSHHYLAFWLEGGKERELRQLPFVYLLSEGRFLPRQDAFLQPPEALPRVARWNANCVQCHAVAGRPGQSEGIDAHGAFWESYQSSVVEFGIACESCHGPGEEHAKLFRNPVTRMLQRNTASARNIYLPDETGKIRASETCGQCHSYFVPRNAGEWWDSGFSEGYQAGDELDISRLVLSPHEENRGVQLEALNEEEVQATDLIDANRESIFWEDGSMIVGGREYNGLKESPCFINAQSERTIGCTSCHSLHRGNRDGQIDPDKLGNQMCLQCHGEIGEEHSRHSTMSAGALCVNCHMPKTSYALLQGLASHRIISPSARFQSPPNACALCHVDKKKSWFLEELARFGVKNHARSEDEDLQDISPAVRGALTGNAAERAIYAFALGSTETLNASGSSVSRRILPILARDPYAAVRLIAERSLSKLEPAPLLHQESPLNPEEVTISRLLKQRDDTPIVISE